MTQPGTWWRRVRGATAVAAALASVFALAGCGSDDQPSSAPAPSPAATAPGLARYDLVVLASAENNPLFSDLYGITLNPLQAYRITTDKRISSMDVDTEQIVVAAADGPTDRLALVTGTGELRPIPGLGRPFAYNPSLLADGTILFEDFTESSREKVNRYRIWDPTRKKKATLFTSTQPLYGLHPGPKGSVALLLNNPTTNDAIVIRDAAGTQRTYPIAGDGGFITWGRTFVTTTLNEPDSQFGSKPKGLVLIDPVTGKRTEVAGWQPIAWTVDGTKLLVRGTDDLANSVLAVLDPSDVQSPQSIGTLENLAIYTGSWIRGNA
ncbi:hypothetical protein [Sporichthya sp.]|uniref:hypothetical protein n=1 Tax=Sporichthya sp. TaxID=65475 RepID=UPI0017E7E65A|nr:hypothetical protein [Sporichthya sp.]MBA3742310.1 hypothetical protein [Sporichthya sp.]